MGTILHQFLTFVNQSKALLSTLRKTLQCLFEKNPHFRIDFIGGYDIIEADFTMIENIVAKHGLFCRQEDNMKKLAGFLAACMLLGGFTVLPVYADDTKVVVGESLQFVEGSGPVIINDRLMLPLRAVSEALDATVYWFNDDKRIQIVLYDTLLSLQIGNTIMGQYSIKNGKAEPKDNFEMDVAATIHNDRTYVPVRAISEAFDATVQWDNTNRTATIVPKERTENRLTVSELASAPEGTLCSVLGVICKDASNGCFYLRSLQQNQYGAYDMIYFCSPAKEAVSTPDSHLEYIPPYWQEQFGNESPVGEVIAFTGVNTIIEDVPYLVINKTTTGVRQLGQYDDYMKGLGLSYTSFHSTIGF
jgi:hypothetical protein